LQQGNVKFSSSSEHCPSARGDGQVLGLEQIKRPDFDFDGAWLQLQEKVCARCCLIGAVSLWCLLH
jgi:hypothetical protein